jgi:hypothetical protein
MRRPMLRLFEGAGSRNTKRQMELFAVTWLVNIPPAWEARFDRSGSCPLEWSHDLCTN